ncbi:MAG TPA: FAD-dependent oxidoreductase [Steroidobacteraceae bacterium]|jgi:NADPH-dependent 2,4-dienoyl-CoA reductase/sulfur reductase-like enzyme/nitrite reductase/ring-hydroxylating ferredoxin subunit
MQASVKPDFSRGIAFSTLPDGAMVAGTAGEDEVILIRRGDELHAVSAFCTHYHGPLSEGLLVGETLRCPLHHACFSIRTGKALRAPALDPISCWRVERTGDTVFVREKLEGSASPAQAPPRRTPRSVVIVGGGAAGLAAADTLRREGYEGPLMLVSADDSPPCDRPNLSKDFLAGTAPDEWIPLRSPEYYTQQRIELALSTRVTSVDTRAKRVVLDGGRSLEFDALLIATGADPVHLEIPGVPTVPILHLRSFADSRAIVAQAAGARRAIIIGASFIALEVAASLRTRGIDVQVVAPESVPMMRVLGSEVGRFVQALHESRGVVFHLGKTVSRVDGRRAALSDGTNLEADFMVAGVGVRPSIELAAAAGLTMDRGVAVDEYLETSAKGIFAAGDVARWPDAHSGERIRVEHWVVAERQGQVAARNILGAGERFDAVPFFWSQHYDVAINYVGHAERWDTVQIDGSVEARDCTITYQHGGRALAVATVGRDRRSLEAELALEGGKNPASS